MKITQRMIAKKAGLSGSAFANIVNGRRRPSWSAAKRIAQITGTTPIFWLEGTPAELRDMCRQIEQTTEPQACPPEALAKNP